MDAEAWFALVKAQADDCRRLGILAIGHGEYSVTYAALPEQTAAGEVDKPDSSVGSDYPLNPLHDPASYPSGEVPGYQIERINILDIDR